jgi:hypothetical protein
MWRWLLINIIIRTAEEFVNTDEMDLKWDHRKHLDA